MFKLLDDSDKFDQRVHEKKNGHKGIDNHISSLSFGRGTEEIYFPQFVLEDTIFEN